ncbi:hypothetical protein Tco_0650719 [Tanacetum coccineum]
MMEVLWPVVLMVLGSIRERARFWPPTSLDRNERHREARLAHSILLGSPIQEDRNCRDLDNDRGITTRSGVVLDGPLPPMPPILSIGNEVGKENELLTVHEIFRGLHFALSFADALIYMLQVALLTKREFILNIDDQSLILKCGDTPTISYDNSESVNRIDLIDATCAEYAPKVLDFTKSGDSTSIILDPSTFSSPFEGISEMLLEQRNRRVFRYVMNLRHEFAR